jgi:actin-related protein
MKRRSHSSNPVTLDIVCDPGSSSIKAGIAGDDTPQIFTHTSADLADNWEMVLDSLNRHTTTESSSSGSIVISENMNAKKSDRERLAELCFEQFGFHHLNISPHAAFVLAARGTNTGIVIDSGASQTQIASVSNGFLGEVRLLNIGGNKISERLVDLMRRSEGHAIDYVKNFNHIEGWKKKFCYIATSHLDEERHVADVTNKLIVRSVLPDGTEVVMNKERFVAPEILFSPRFLGGSSYSESPGVSTAVAEILANSPIDLRANLLGSIILAGGSTLFKGFADRLRNETGGHVDADPGRELFAFQGASMVACMHDKNTSDWWIGRAEYDECGAGAIRRLGKINI